METANRQSFLTLLTLLIVSLFAVSFIFSPKALASYGVLQTCDSKATVAFQADWLTQARTAIHLYNGNQTFDMNGNISAILFRPTNGNYELWVSEANYIQIGENNPSTFIRFYNTTGVAKAVYKLSYSSSNFNIVSAMTVSSVNNNGYLSVYNATPTEIYCVDAVKNFQAVGGYIYSPGAIFPYHSILSSLEKDSPPAQKVQLDSQTAGFKVNTNISSSDITLGGGSTGGESSWLDKDNVIKGGALALALLLGFFIIYQFRYRGAR